MLFVPRHEPCYSPITFFGSSRYHSHHKFNFTEAAFLQGQTLRWGATEENISVCNGGCRAASCSPYHGVRVGHLEELSAALGIPKGADPQAVGGVELLHEEIAAHLDDLGELQKACSSQQTLYGVFF